jgi:hypothetical protein
MQLMRCLYVQLAAACIVVKRPNSIFLKSVTLLSTIKRSRSWTETIDTRNVDI